MLDQKTIDAIAHGYLEAERTRRRVRPPSAQYPGFGIEEAYAVQRRWVALKLKEGRSIKGHKIGLTSRAMQSVAGINEPDYGALLDDMFYADGAEIPVNRFIEPRLECELAFILGKPLAGPGCTIFDVLNAADYVIPAVEIIDSRTLATDPETKANRMVQDSIAANAGNAALVTGGRPVKPLEVDLRWVAALCYRNGVIEESGVAAAVMNHPANGIVWLVNKLAEHGETLQAGEVILAGSFTRTVPARAGDFFHIDYGPLGAITCRFV
jgi:2-oxo-hept-3-ene-1,7-dioate hydratase